MYHKTSNSSVILGKIKNFHNNTLIYAKLSCLQPRAQFKINIYNDNAFSELCFNFLLIKLILNFLFKWINKRNHSRMKTENIGFYFL